MSTLCPPRLLAALVKYWGCRLQSYSFIKPMITEACPLVAEAQVAPPVRYLAAVTHRRLGIQPRPCCRAGGGADPRGETAPRAGATAHAWRCFETPSAIRMIASTRRARKPSRSVRPIGAAFIQSCFAGSTSSRWKSPSRFAAYRMRTCAALTISTEKRTSQVRRTDIRKAENHETARHGRLRSDHAAQGAGSDLSSAEQIGMMVDHEWTARDNRRMGLLLET